MSYLSTVSEIRAAANAVNPNGTFDHGRIVDLSQAFNKTMPYIWLYPFEIRDTEGDGFIDTSTLLVGFWQQDRPDTSVYERESIIGEMQVLCKAFKFQLMSNNLVRVTGFISEPQYQQHQGTLSGFACRFQYENFDPCIDD